MEAVRWLHASGQRYDPALLGDPSPSGVRDRCSVSEDRDRCPRPVRGQPAAAAARGARSRFQRRLPRAYSRSGDGHPGRHRIGSRRRPGRGDRSITEDFLQTESEAQVSARESPRGLRPDCGEEAQ
jgi:hypothetical protein